MAIADFRLKNKLGLGYIDAKLLKALAIILPYAAESYPLHIRGRATGWIAACTKAGGLGAQALSIAALVPPLGAAPANIAL